MKNLFITLIAATAILVGGMFASADACYYYNNDKSIKIWNSNCNVNHNENTNKNSNSNSNKNTNLNTNLNSNDNTNVNVNKNIAVAGAAAAAINKGNKQSIVINEADIPVAYNHITPSVDAGNASLTDHDAVSDVKVQGSLLDYIKTLDVTMAKRAAKGASDIVVESAILWEPAVQLKNVNLQSKAGTYMGSVTFTTDGPDATMDQMIARAVVESAKLGATDIFITDDEGKFLDAVQYGIGFGGSASIAATGDGSAVVAPGFGTGYSRAKSSNEMRPALFVVLFHNADSIVE